MKKLLTTLCLSFCTFLTFSQTNNLTLIYKITPEQAAELYNNYPRKFGEQHLHTLVDSFRTETYQATLPYGHYAFLKAEEEKVAVKIQAVYNITVQTINNDKDLALIVLDSVGNRITNADIRLKKKKIKFDKKTQTYRLKRTWRFGFLTVKANNQTLYYDLEKDQVVDWYDFWYEKGEDIAYWFRYKLRHKVPIRTAVNIYRSIAYRIEEGEWRNKRKNRAKYQKNSGYIAINQPKFRPNDTVKVKIYLAKKNGKPIRKTVEVRLYEGSSYQYSPNNNLIFKTSIPANKDGNYAYEFVLGDSLKLDENYSVTFGKPSKRKMKYYRDIDFRYEDYELDKIDYSIANLQKKYVADEKVIFKASGKDQNDNFIPDGEIKLTLLPNGIREYYENDVLVADTLWQFQQQLNAQSVTQILVPADVFPPVKMKVKVLAEFFNSNGEYYDKTLIFEIDNKKEWLRIDLKEEMISIISAYPNQKATLINTIIGNKKPVTQEITLPFKTPINPHFASYTVVTQEDKATLNLRRAGASVDFSGQRTKDSVFVQFSNPRKLPIIYIIEKENKRIVSGEMTERQFLWKQKDKGGEAYFIQYQYVWAGHHIYEKRKLLHYKNLLNIDLEQPSVVSPNETVQIKVAVKDSKNRPAQNVNLTAGAINAAFDATNHYKPPSIKVKKEHKKRKDKRFYVKKFKVRDFTIRLTSKLYDRLKLKEKLFYRLRFPENGIYMQYDTITTDTFYHKIAQFAPYVVKNGREQTVYLIYCNEELVYYSGLTGNLPYSFIGREGWNKITLRTKEYEYHLDSVYLKKGHKLELSLDENHYIRHPLSRNIKKLKTLPYFTDFEKKLLRSKVFLVEETIEYMDYIVWQGDDKIYTFKGGYDIKPIGLFDNTEDIQFIKKNGYETLFPFESGYVYDVSKHRERLYYYNKAKQNTYLPFKAKTTLHLPKAVVHSPTMIKDYFSLKELEPTSSPSFYASFNSFRRKFRRKRPRFFKTPGSYAFELNEEEETGIFAVIVQRNNLVYKIVNTQNFILDAGTYEMLVFRKDSTYFQKEITVHQDTLHYERFENLFFKTDTNFQLLKRIQEANSLKPKKEVKDTINKKLNQELQRYRGGNTIIGRVREAESGESLIGVNVTVKGTVIGTTTDIDGDYRLKVPNRALTLVFSYTGYATREIEIEDVRVLDVELDAGGMKLEEVVVVGYGVQKKSALTASVSTVLAGKLPGVALGVTGKEKTKSYEIIPKTVNQSLKVDATSTANNHLRTDFRDYAYWQPYLMTDKNGEAFFTVTFPDNITTWESFVLGMDRKKRGGIALQQTKSFKLVMAEVAIPRFLVEGDKVEIVGKSINYSSDTFDIQTTFKQNGQIIKTNNEKLATAVIEKTTIEAGEPTDSLQLSYQLTSEKYADGEERSIPVFRKGVEESIGDFYVLKNDTTLTIDFDTKYGKVELYAQENVLGLLLKDIEYLKKYPYGCNEQTASRLMALVMDQQIQKALGKSVNHKKMIAMMIERLRNTQNKNGSWGWWENGKGSIWITVHVLKALKMVLPESDKDYTEGVRILANNLHTLKGNDLILAVDFLTGIGLNLEYDKYLSQIDSSQLTLYQKLNLIKIAQNRGVEISTDSVLIHQKQTTLGGKYWGTANYRWFNNSIETTLLAYQILKKAKQTAICEDIVQYFMESRKQYYYRSTFKTAKILSTILPDLISSTDKGIKSELVLKQGTQQIATIASFPYKVAVSPNQPIIVEKKGQLPVFLTTYQTFHNEKPQPKKDIFEVTTSFTQKGKLVKKSKITANSPIKMLVEVEVKESAEYVLLELPIPAGCSYEIKSQSYRNWEVHREYFKNKVAIFCERLPIGTHTFEVRLEPRFTGTYTLNPAKVEQMYFPVFYGRNGVEKVEIR